ncbi:MAG: hypothetical protein LBS33_03050 [Streptococcaceae bacterium]|jgi:hypothetical protein|nr:hypothetical protein [Streptococcaceae bacterium]
MEKMKKILIKKWLEKVVTFFALLLLVVSSTPLSIFAVTGDGGYEPNTATEEKQVHFNLRTTDGGRTYRLTALDVWHATGIKSVIIEIPSQASFQATVPEGWVAESQEADPMKSYIINNGATKETVLSFLKSIVLTSQTAAELTGEVRVEVYQDKVAARKEAGKRHYYLVSNTQENWLNAYNSAITSNPDGGTVGLNGLKGHLATITSAAEQNFTYFNFVDEYGWSDYWLGGTRLRTVDGNHKIGEPETVNADGTLKSTDISAYKTTTPSDTDSWYWATANDELMNFYSTPIMSATGNIDGVFHYFDNPYSSYIVINGKDRATEFEAQGSTKNGGNEPNDSVEYCLESSGKWNDLNYTSRSLSSLIEYEETDTEAVYGANALTVHIATPADTTDISIFANKGLFPLADGSTRLILTKMQMNSGETINNNGIPTGDIDGEKVDGALFELYDVSDYYQMLITYYEYAELRNLLAPALSAKQELWERITPEDALVQIQYEITSRRLRLGAATAFPLTGSSIYGHTETGVTYMDVANFRNGSEKGRVYAILQRDSASSGILYYQQPLVVALPYYQDNLEQDIVYLYPKGITEGIRKSVIPNTDLGDQDITGDGLVDSLFVSRNFGETLDYVIELPIPKDVDTIDKFKQLQMTDSLATGLEDLGLQNLRIGGGEDLAENYQNLPDTEPASFDQNGIKAWRDIDGLHLTFVINDNLKANKGNLITLNTKARVTSSLPINQSIATNVRYICDFTDNLSTDFDVQAYSEGVMVGGLKLTNRDESQKVISGQRFKVKKGDFYLVQDAQTLAITKTTNSEAATEFTTDNDGTIYVKGLALGADYALIQSYSHEVYQPAIDGIIKVDTLNPLDEEGDGSEADAPNRFAIVEQPLKADMTEDDNLTLLSVTNYHRGFLPQTGQMGALILIIIALFGLGLSARYIHKNREGRKDGIEIEEGVQK